MAGVAAIAAWSLTVAVPQLSAYVGAAEPHGQALRPRSPPAAAGTTPAPVLAMHQSLLRPLEAETATSAG